MIRRVRCLDRYPFAYHWILRLSWLRLFRRLSSEASNRSRIRTSQNTRNKSMMLHGRASLFHDITVSGRECAKQCVVQNYCLSWNGLPKTERDLPFPSVNTYRADRSVQKIRSVAARQNARLFGYYVSAYGREPGNQIGWSRMTRALTRGVNIFILFYPCNSSVANLASIAKFRSRFRRRFSYWKSKLHIRFLSVANFDNSRSRK